MPSKKNVKGNSFFKKIPLVKSPEYHISTTGKKLKLIMFAHLLFAKKNASKWHCI